MKISPDETNNRIQNMLNSFEKDKPDRGVIQKVNIIKKDFPGNLDPLDEALVLADAIIDEQWPDLYSAMVKHRLGPNPSDIMDFTKYPAQVAFLQDGSQHKIAMKCVQVGITECLLVSAIRRASEGWRVLYSFPTERLRDDMVKDRVDMVIRYSPYYAEAVKSSVGGSEDIGLKHIGEGSLRFVASKSDVAFLAFPADMIIIDEEDKSDPKNIAMAPDRLQASDKKYDWRVGNPTYPKRGIHFHYLKSDQKEWYIECEHCGDKQPLDFFVNIVEEVATDDYILRDKDWTSDCGRDIQVYCRSCENTLNRYSSGKWISTNPKGTISGYHFSQLFSPTVSITEIYNSYVEACDDLTKLQIFHNSRLGVPWVAIGQSLSRSDLDKCKHDYYMPKSAEECTMGVDVGTKLNVRISDHPEPHIKRAVYIGTVDDFEELSILIERFNVVTCVIDSRPETRKCQELQDKHPDGLVWLCDYGVQQATLDFWKLDMDKSRIITNRTSSIDESISRLLRGENWLPKNNIDSLDDGDYVEQMTVSVRIRDDSGPRPRFVWDERSKPDHHFHADNYDNLADKIKREIGSNAPFVTVARL